MVLTGTDRAFCTGADLKWLGSCHDPSLAVADLVAVYHAAIVLLLVAACSKKSDSNPTATKPTEAEPAKTEPAKVEPAKVEPKKVDYKP